MSKKPASLTVPRSLLELALRALEDAETEIEAFEKGADWYMASQRMMDRLERAQRELGEILK